MHFILGLRVNSSLPGPLCRAFYESQVAELSKSVCYLPVHFSNNQTHFRCLVMNDEIVTGTRDTFKSSNPLLIECWRLSCQPASGVAASGKTSLSDSVLSINDGISSHDSEKLSYSSTLTDPNSRKQECVKTVHYLMKFAHVQFASDILSRALPKPFDMFVVAIEAARSNHENGIGEFIAIGTPIVNQDMTHIENTLNSAASDKEKAILRIKVNHRVPLPSSRWSFFNAQFDTAKQTLDDERETENHLKKFRAEDEFWNEIQPKLTRNFCELQEAIRTASFDNQLTNKIQPLSMPNVSTSSMITEDCFGYAMKRGSTTPSTKIPVGVCVASAYNGRLTGCQVSVGQSVEQVLFVIEAMKLESNVRAPEAGIISDILVSLGQAVRKGLPLATISPPIQ